MAFFHDLNLVSCNLILQYIDVAHNCLFLDFILYLKSIATVLEHLLLVLKVYLSLTFSIVDNRSFLEFDM